MRLNILGVKILTHMVIFFEKGMKQQGMTLEDEKILFQFEFYFCFLIFSNL